jgi:hypothetical protein
VQDGQRGPRRREANESVTPRRLIIDVSTWRAHESRKRQGRPQRGGRQDGSRPARKMAEGLSATVAERVLDRQIAGMTGEDD